jgi:hypothetical protein
MHALISTYFKSNVMQNVMQKSELILSRVINPCYLVIDL